MLELKFSVHGSILNIELKGALDSESSHDFKSWVIDKNLNGYSNFSLDCLNLEYISSRGIGTISDLNKILKSKNAHLMLYNVSNEVFNLLDFLKIADHLLIYSNFSEILNKYKGSIIQEPIIDSGYKEETAKDEIITSERKPDLIENLKNEAELIVEDSVQGLENIYGSYHTTFMPQQSEISKSSVAEKESNITVTETISRDIETKTIKKDPEPANKKINIIIECSNCGTHLRITQKGQYLCPECRYKFSY